MTTMKSWRRSIGACALMVGLAVGAAVPVVAQDQPADQTSPAQQSGGFDLAQASVGLHAGSCAAPTPEPWAEGGTLQPAPFGAAVPESGVQIGESADTAVGIQTDDTADTEAGVETGATEDTASAIETGDTADTTAGVQTEGGDEPAAGAADLTQPTAGVPTIWKAEAVIDAPFEQMFSEQNAIAIHESPETLQNVLACGDLSTAGEWQGQDQIVIGLRPVQGSDFFGFAVFEQDTSGQVFGANASGLTVYLFENLPTQLSEGQDTATSGTS
jgi:hypothetical protein